MPPDESQTPSNTSEPDLNALPPGVRRIIEGAEQRQREGKHTQLGANHWLLEAIARHRLMVEEMAEGIEAASLQKYLYEQMREGNTGEPLSVAEAVSRATERARERGKETPSERDLVAVVLAAAQYAIKDAGVADAIASGESATIQTAGAEAAAGPEDAAGYRPRATRPTPTLEQYGRDMTRQAQEGKLLPVVGREEELELVIETLCRRGKRNPVLVGPAGVGKTAIVEGLAQRISRGEVPATLKNVRLLALQPSTLVAGASVVGELEKRMKAILAEAAQDGIVLFIDEVHSMIGAGGTPGSSDMASLLKPALARGDIACIAATTDDEYRRYIEGDTALERRFQPVRVHQLTPEQTLDVLKALRDDLTRLRNVQLSDAVLHQLIDAAEQFMRNRHFPDKGVDLLEQCVAYAVAHGKSEVSEADARAVVQRMVGMPLALVDRLSALRERLGERALLSEEDIDTLVSRLNVTMRGLDLRQGRPNAVVLLAGELAEAGDAVGEVISETLFGSEERVVSIDFSRFVHPADVTSLIGAPPGYVGYSDSLPLHKVAQMPWCVLLCENVELSHPQVLAVLVQALRDGFISEASGKRIYLSDCVVLLTAGSIEPTAFRPLGFYRDGDGEAQQSNAREAVEQVVGEGLADQVDLIGLRAPHSGESQRRWLEKELLSDLSERYGKAGVSVQWDESLVKWLLEQQETHGERRHWERVVDEKLGSLLVRYLPDSGAPQKRALKVKWNGDQIQVDELPQMEETDGIPE
jgi:ATP-dependent Clp protease ATP-binding subunit ClpC